MDDARAWLAAAKPGERRLYASPTGTGKSVMELELVLELDSNTVPYENPWLITPRLEILEGFLNKLGVPTADLSEAALVEAAWSRRLTTPIRLRNAMLAGRGPTVDCLVLDEAHHHTASTYQQLDLLTGQVPTVGFTATPYRGSPKGTAALLEAWGPPVWVLTYPEAVARGHLAFPGCEVVPLLDDDVVELSNGEFSVRAVSAAVSSRLTAVVENCRRFVQGGLWDRPTMFAAPDTQTALLLADLLEAAGLPAVPVTQATPRVGRSAAFTATLARAVALVQINVVSEGVDLPIRRLIDLSPMMSPVRWLQQFGRITRPVTEGEAPPHYVCTNRNLLRHAYLLNGCVPPATLAAATAAFGGLGKRAAARVLGLEALGRLKAAELPLLDGTTGLAYCVSDVRGATVTEYAVLFRPDDDTPIWARRTRTTTAYGKWAACEPPADLQGFASVPPRPLSEKQAAWWERAAARHGLDPAATVTRKNFVALPVLADLKEKL